MATGSGKTYTAVNFIYRLIKYAGARRVLFLVDRGNLGRQTLKEFQQFVTPDERPQVHRAIQRPAPHQRTRSTPSARVVICTIQRLYSMLKGEQTPDARPRRALPHRRRRHALLHGSPSPVDYNPAIPIETFDFIVTDECHRSIYNLWRQVLEYFDAFLIGLTATPSKQTFGFFNQNLVMEYNHEQAVADGVNVGYDVYRIDTADHRRAAARSRPASTWTNATARPAKSAGSSSTKTSPTTPHDLDRDVVAPDQIRTVLTHLPRRALHRDLPRPHRRAQDPHLRQGRHPRRRHRPHLPRGVRQGQRLLPEDHLPSTTGDEARRTSSHDSATATTRASPSPWT